MANGVFPVDPTTNVGKVRILINDTVERADPKNPSASPEYLFSDDFIGGFLSLNGENPKFAAADALDALATNEAMVSKKIRTESLQTDGAAVANAIRGHADKLRIRARQEEEVLESESAFEIVNFIDPVTSWDLFELTEGGDFPWR